MPRQSIYLLISLLMASLLAGCSQNPVGTPVDPTPLTPSAVASTVQPVGPSTEPPTPAPPTSTPSPALAVLLSPPGTAATLSGPVRRALQAFSGQADLLMEEHADLGALGSDANVRLIVALPGTPDLLGAISARPETSFLAIGIPGLAAAPNLSQIGPAGLRPDRQAFVAGYLAAIATKDWRVGVVTQAGAAGGAENRIGFLNGARYFCGLCRPTLPPFADYPLFDEVASGADEATQQAAADRLLAQGVRTVFLQPEIETPYLQGYLAEAGVALIGTEPLLALAEGQWLASVVPAPESAVDDILPGLVNGAEPVLMPMPFRIEPGPGGLLSPGRLDLARSVIPDLLGGFIDTGVNPAGETVE